METGGRGENSAEKDWRSEAGGGGGGTFLRDTQVGQHRFYLISTSCRVDVNNSINPLNFEHINLHILFITTENRIEIVRIPTTTENQGKYSASE